MGNTVNIKGELLTLLGSKNTDGVIVVELNELNQVRRGEGATAPSSKAGYAIGGSFVNTTNGAVYRNTGTAASCTFTLMVPVTTSSVTGTMIGLVDTANGKTYHLTTTNGVLELVEV